MRSNSARDASPPLVFHILLVRGEVRLEHRGTGLPTLPCRVSTQTRPLTVPARPNHTKPSCPTCPDRPTHKIAQASACRRSSNPLAISPSKSQEISEISSAADCEGRRLTGTTAHSGTISQGCLCSQNLCPHTLVSAPARSRDTDNNHLLPHDPSGGKRTRTNFETRCSRNRVHAQRKCRQVCMRLNAHLSFHLPGKSG